MMLLQHAPHKVRPSQTVHAQRGFGPWHPPSEAFGGFTGRRESDLGVQPASQKQRHLPPPALTTKDLSPLARQFGPPGDLPVDGRVRPGVPKAVPSPPHPHSPEWSLGPGAPPEVPGGFTGRRGSPAWVPKAAPPPPPALARMVFSPPAPRPGPLRDLPVDGRVRPASQKQRLPSARTRQNGL
jgi:hypothetical protein